jgi:hypothetical protein
MPKLDEMKAELRGLRKEAVKPISKMRKGDISAELERLRAHREETPAAAAVPSAPVRMSRAASETIKHAKAEEFPVAPAPLKKKGGAAAAAAEPKKKVSKAALMKMLAELSSDSE